MSDAVTWVGLVLLALLLEAEVLAWIPAFHRLLLRLAARRLPSPLAERYLEEWTTELQSIPPGPVTRLAFAVSILLRAGGLRRELGVQQADKQGSLLIAWIWVAVMTLPRLRAGKTPFRTKADIREFRSALAHIGPRDYYRLFMLARKARPEPAREHPPA